MTSSASPGRRHGERRRLAVLAALAAALICAQAAIFFHLQWAIASAVLVLAAAGIAVVIGAPPAAEPDLAPATAASRWQRAAGVALALAGMLIAAWAAWQLTINWAGRFDLAAPLALLGTLICSAGIAIADRRAQPFTFGREAMPRWERWALPAIVVLAFAFRFYRFSDFPPPDGICAIEEPQTGQLGWEILRGARPWEFLLDRWLAAAGIRLGGANLTAVRLPFTIVSALTVLPLYWLLRCLVSRAVAVTVALLFAVCHWHLVYARYAHNIYLTTFLVVVILYLMVRARQDSRLAFYPWIGLLSAYTLYTYAGYRGTTLFVGLFLGGALVVDAWRARQALSPTRRQRTRRWLQRQVLASALVAIAYLVPLVPLVRAVIYSPWGPNYYFEAAHRAVDDSGYYNPSLARSLALRLERLRHTAMIFNHAGEDYATMNLPGVPMLDPATGALFTAGLFYCLLCPRRRHQGFFAAMFLVLLMMGTVFVHNFDVRRLQGIIPLIFILVALLLERVRELLAAAGRRGELAFAGLLAVVLPISYARNIDVYFVKMMNSAQVLGAFHNRYTVAIRYLHQLPDNAFLLLVADLGNFFQPSDYEWMRGTRVPGQATSDLYPLLEGQPGRWPGKELYVLLKEPYATQDLAAFLREQFPGTTCGPVDAPHHREERYVGCHVAVPSQQAEAPRPAWVGQGGGLRARYYHGDAAQPFVDRVEPCVEYALTPNVCHLDDERRAPPCRVSWEGTWSVEAESEVAWQLETRAAQAQIFIDGEPAGQLTRLQPGPHTISITAELEQGEENGVRVKWRQREGGRGALLPFYRLTTPARDGG
ncbi:MAG: glycosyltransferase family 39 protein [Deltaproteobacteria bacterium]|nr:glycosyltransferase family 39 protein [Deltaproteobacteria bacterium]